MPIVEACKRSLTNNKKLQYSVDWLTEVIHRLSDAALAAKPLSSVTMKSPIRTEKVDVALLPYFNTPLTPESVEET